MSSFAALFLYFIIYSFCGWVWEVIYFAVVERRFSNGGVVSAPLLPIYGIGAILIILLVEPYIHNPFYVFVVSALLASVVEFTGHWLLEKLFVVRLWDYRNLPFNLQGRICLVNSIGFGILALALLYVIHPFVSSLIPAIPPLWLVVIATVAALIFIADLSNSTVSMTKLRFSPEFVASLSEARSYVEDRLERARELRRQSRKNISGLKLASLNLHKTTVKRLSKRFPSAALLSRCPKKGIGGDRRSCRK